MYHPSSSAVSEANHQAMAVEEDQSKTWQKACQTLAHDLSLQFCHNSLPDIASECGDGVKECVLIDLIHHFNKCFAESVGQLLSEQGLSITTCRLEEALAKLSLPTVDGTNGKEVEGADSRNDSGDMAGTDCFNLD